MIDIDTLLQRRGTGPATGVVVGFDDVTKASWNKTARRYATLGIKPDKKAPGLYEPLRLRVYDNHAEKTNNKKSTYEATTDRYTLTFPRVSMGGNGIPRSYPYTDMSAYPFHPQGICQHGETNYNRCDIPSYGHLGKQIRFRDLPPDCQWVALRDYADWWELPCRWLIVDCMEQKHHALYLGYAPEDDNFVYPLVSRETSEDETNETRR